MREPSVNNAVNDEAARALLDGLPTFAPSAELWPRIRAAHESSKPRARRSRYWPAIGIAAAAAIAAVLIVPRTPSEPGRVEPGFAEAQRESQSLEREWQALLPASVRPAADLARLHVIDTALQSAYDRGAEPDELQPLWRQRNEALRGLIINTRGDAITRI